MPEGQLYYESYDKKSLSQVIFDKLDWSALYVSEKLNRNYYNEEKLSNIHKILTFSLFKKGDQSGCPKK